MKPPAHFLARTRMARAWSRLSSTQRRRIVLGSLLAAAVAARDLVLFGVASSLFALSEMTPAPRAVASPT